MFKRSGIAMAGALALLACTTTQLNKFNATMAQVPAYEAKAKEDLANFASGAITSAKVVGQSFCGLASMLNGAFGVAVQVASIDPKIMASEAAAMAIVEVACAVLDKADPTTPVPTILTATQQVIGAVPTIKEAVHTIGG